MKTARFLLTVLLAVLFCVGIVTVQLGCDKKNPTEPLSQTTSQDMASGNQTQTAASTAVAMNVMSISVNGVRQNLPTPSNLAPAIKISQGDNIALNILLSDAAGQTAVGVVDALGLMCSQIPLLPQSGSQTVTYNTQVNGTGVLHIRFIVGGTSLVVRFFVGGPYCTNVFVEDLKQPIEEALANNGMPGTVLAIRTALPSNPAKTLGVYHPPSYPGIFTVNSTNEVNEANCEAILYGVQLEQANLTWGTATSSTILDPTAIYHYPDGVADLAKQICVEKRKHSTDFITNVADLVAEDAQDVVHVGAYIVVGGACVLQPELVVPCVVLVTMAKQDAASDLTQAAARTIINAHYQELGWTPEYRDVVLKATTFSTIFGPKAKIPSILDKRTALTSKKAIAAYTVNGYWGKVKSIKTGLEVTNVLIVNNTIVADFINEDVSIAIPIPNPTPPANTAPTPCLSISPQGGSGTTATVFTLTSCSTDNETPADALLVRWQVNGTWTSFSTTKTITNQWQTPGTYPVVLEVKDTGGLTAQVTKTVTVSTPANRPPVVSVPTTANATVNVPITITITKSDPDGDAVQVAVDAGDQSNLEWIQGASYTHTFRAAGVYNVRFTGYDGKLWSQTAICAITVAGPVNHPPVVIVPATASATVNVPVTITITKSDPDGDAVRVATDWGDNSFEWVQGTSGIHTFKSVGSYNVRFTGYDGKAWSQTAICVVTVSAPANTPPTACMTVSPSSGSGTTSTVFLFDAQCSTDKETPADALQVRWQINGTWRPFTTLKGITNQWSTPGTYTVVLEVKDAGGLTAQTTKTITVGAVTVPLTILTTSVPNGNLLSNYSATFACSGGTDGYSVTWYISGTPPGLSFRNNADRTATLSGVPGAQGSFPFTVTVKDMGDPTNIVSKNFTLIVNPPLNNPPTVSVASTGTGQVGATTVIPYTATDRETPSANLCVAVDWLDGSPIDYFWGGAPATHVYRSIGTYGARFTAWDGTNWSATATCYITVTNSCSNMPTLLGPINGQTVSLSAGFSFFWTKVCDGFGEYNLYVMTAPNASGRTVFADRMNPSYTSIRYWGTGLQPNTTYYWCLQMGNYTGAPLTPFASFRTAP